MGKLTRILRSPRRSFQVARNAIRGEGAVTNNQLKIRRSSEARQNYLSQFGNAQLPDDETLQREHRRKLAGRRGSRASTVMTDRDTLG